MDITLLFYFIFYSFMVMGVALIKYNHLKRWRLDTFLDKKVIINHIKILKIYKYFQKIKNEKKNEEIYEAIAFLRNMTANGKGSIVSSDFVIQQLANHKGVLQKTYIKMLSYLRINKKEEAELAFFQDVGTPMGKEFSRLLIKWDEMNPKGLSEILLSHQKSMKEIRVTIQKKRDEIISDLIYFPVVINVIFIFINFIYIGYFLDQKELLKMFL